MSRPRPAASSSSTPVLRANGAQRIAVRIRVACVIMAALAALVAPRPGTAQATMQLPDAVRAAGDRIEAEQLRRDVAYLASDELRGRDTNSAGFDSAAVFIARRLEQAGLPPLGDDGGYFQYYDLRELHADTAAAWIGIDGRRHRFGAGFRMASFAGALAGTYRVVYVGHGWTVPDRDIDPWGDLDVRGKLVLAHGPPSAPPGVELRRIGRITVNAVSPWEEARRRGAAGILFITPSASLEQVRALGAANTVRRELEPNVPSAYAALPLTGLHLLPSLTAALLAGERVSGPDLVTRGDSADYPASFELVKSVTVNLPAAVDTVHRPYNIVALLQGSDPALRDEFITVMAHLDGAVGSVPVNGDSIYNSADDNATGSAGILAVAEQLARAPRPKRSVIFVWDSGEERGLWGTRHFVNTPPVPLDNIVAHFNIDMIGATRTPTSADSATATVTEPDEVYLTGPGVLSTTVNGLLEAVNRGYLGMTFNRDYDTDASEFFYPRTDAGPFLERGILTIGFFTGIHDRYHLPADELRYLDPQKMEAVARTVLASVWMLADAPDRPAIDREIPATVPRHR